MELRAFINDALMVGLEYKGDIERATASVLFAAVRHPSFQYWERGREMPVWVGCLERIAEDG